MATRMTDEQFLDYLKNPDPPMSKEELSEHMSSLILWVQKKHMESVSKLDASPLDKSIAKRLRDK